MRRSSVWLPAAALILSACADRSPLATMPAEPDPANLQRLECVASVAGRIVVCGGGDARRNIIGGQGQYLRLASSNVSFDAGTGSFQFDLTVQNLLPYPIGTRDGTTADSGGVKVFLSSGPVTTGGTGTVTVQNPDGVGAFTATGQPFFKYPGMLATSQVSAPRTWILHADPGVQTFAFTLLVETRVPASAFRIIEPLPGATVTADSLLVRVTASPPPLVNFIRASVGARSILLAYTDTGGWRGKVPLAGLPAGPLVLRVAATAPADSTVQTVAFNYPLVDFALALPAEGSVARPQLRVQGTCDDATGCTVTAQVGGTVLFTAPGPAFDQTPSFAAWEGTRQTLTVTGRDGDGHVAQATRTVFVESTPRWVEVGAGGTRALAADSLRVLFRDSSAAGDALRLYTRATGTTEVVLSRPTGQTLTYASLTPVGMVFTLLGTSQGPLQVDTLFEYRDGTLSTLGTVLNREIFLNGGFLAWHSPGDSYLRDLVAGTTIAPNLNYPTVMGVGPNGDVLYSYNNDVWRWRAGTNTQISTGGGRQAKTDGTNIVFRYHETQIGLYDGTSVTSISGTAAGWEANNGWVAFSTYDTNVVNHVWVRTPGGSFVQVSRGAVKGLLVALGAGGEVVYAQGGRRYLSAPPYATAVDVGADWLTVAPVRFDGSAAYTVLGRSAFRVTP
jgi:hypothetical protein